MVETTKTRSILNNVQAFYKDRVDECGRPVIDRLKWVAEQMEDETTVITALLQEIMSEPLRAWPSLVPEFPSTIFEATHVLYYSEDIMPYDRYIDHVIKNEIAAKVKIKDLEYRSNPENYLHLTTALIDRILLYRSAYWQMFFHRLNLDHVRLQYEERTAIKTNCCGDILPIGYRYCPTCGKEIDNAICERLRYGFDIDVTRTFCEKCGNWEPANYMYCGHCGRKLRST